MTDVIRSSDVCGDLVGDGEAAAKGFYEHQAIIHCLVYRAESLSLMIKKQSLD